MSAYMTQMEKARTSDLSHKSYLSDIEGAAYVGIGRTKFRELARQIGCRRKVGTRVLNDRAMIDEALRRGDVS